MNININRKIEEFFGIDLRSLAVFRIGLGLLVLADLFGRFSDFNVFYTDGGILPRALLLQQFPSLFRISVHLASGSALFEGVLFVLAALSAVCLVMGVRTRIATVLSWFLLMSLHVRNPMVLHSGDYLLRLLLFWGMFLPLGSHLSKDSSAEPVKRNSSVYFLSMGTVALLMQVVFVFVSASAAKWGDPSWTGGRAVYQTLQTSQYATFFGSLLRLLPRWFLSVLSYTVFCFETLGPLLLFAPVFTGPVRTAAVFGFFLMQMGFGIFMDLGLFPWVASVAMLPFIPAWAWDNIFQRFKMPKVEIGTEKRKSSRPANVVLSLLLIYVLWINLSMRAGAFQIPRQLSWIGEVLYLDQNWSMFTPPDEASAWFVVAGSERDGTAVDLLRKKPGISWDAPRSFSSTYKNLQWYKYMGHLWSPAYSNNLPYYAGYKCREWNRRHRGDKQLAQLLIYSASQRFYPQGESPQYSLLWMHNCMPETKTEMV